MQSLAELQKLTPDALIGRITTESENRASVDLELGKIIIALEPHRGDNSIAGFIRKKAGVEADKSLCNAYKAATVFRDLVSDDPAIGQVSEHDYDLFSLRWCIQSAIILNALEDKPAEVSADTRIQIANILRAGADAKRNGKDYPVSAQLDELKTKIIPKKEKTSATVDSPETLAKVTALEQERDAMVKERDSLKARVSEAEQNGKVIMRQMGELTDERDSLKTRVAELERENAELKASTSAATVKQLALIAGKLLELGTEASLAEIAPMLEPLPQALRDPLAALYQIRVESLAA